MRPQLSCQMRVPPLARSERLYSPWLAESENLSLLSDAVGLGELELSRATMGLASFKLDVLCTDGTHSTDQRSSRASWRKPTDQVPTKY